MSSSNSISFPARIYKRGSDNPGKVILTVDLGQLIISANNGNDRSAVSFDTIDLRLGGTGQDRIVLYCILSGDTIIANEPKLLDIMEYSNKCPVLAQKIGKAKWAHRTSFIHKSTGLLVPAAIALLFIAWLYIGFSHLGRSDTRELSSNSTAEPNSANKVQEKEDLDEEDVDTEANKQAPEIATKPEPAPVTQAAAPEVQAEAEPKKEAEPKPEPALLAKTAKAETAVKNQPLLASVPIVKPNPNFSNADDYMNYVQKHLKKNWHPPTSKVSKVTVVQFLIDSNGGISKTKIVKSSGNKRMDEAAIKAVKAAVPFASPPSSLSSPVGIEFSFEYNVRYKKS